MRRGSKPDRRRFWPRVIAGQILGWAYYRCERYVWHELDLSAAPVTVHELPDGVRLRPAIAEDLPALVKIEMPLLDRFEEFTERGGELCIVENAEGIMAALWIFRTQMPLYPWLELPDDVGAIEHGVTAPSGRGRGLMPAVLVNVAERLRSEGRRLVVLKILDTNKPSLKTVNKVGFRPVALMHQVKILGTHRTVIEPAADFGRYLAMHLTSSAPWGI